jgi:DNA-binding transcriptional LysR family regulator
MGVVRIGIFSSLASGFLADLLRAFVVSNPAIRPELVEGGPSSHIAAIRRHHLDIAFLTGEPIADGCEIAHLWNERVYVALPRDHELARKREIPWKSLRDRRFIISETDPGPEIHDYLVKHLAEFGHHPSVERHGVGRDNLMHLVAIGQGLTLTSEATTAARFPTVVYRPLAEEILPFCTVWSPQNENPALRRLLSLARSMSKRSKGGLIQTSSSTREVPHLAKLARDHSGLPDGPLQSPDRLP